MLRRLTLTDMKIETDKVEFCLKKSSSSLFLIKNTLPYPVYISTNPISGRKPEFKMLSSNGENLRSVLSTCRAKSWGWKFVQYSLKL